jgi:hypothetical protein
MSVPMAWPLERENSCMWWIVTSRCVNLRASVRSGLYIIEGFCKLKSGQVNQKTVDQAVQNFLRS